MHVQQPSGAPGVVPNSRPPGKGAGAGAGAGAAVQQLHQQFEQLSISSIVKSHPNSGATNAGDYATGARNINIAASSNMNMSNSMQVLPMASSASAQPLYAAVGVAQSPLQVQVPLLQTVPMPLANPEEESSSDSNSIGSEINTAVQQQPGALAFGGGVSGSRSGSVGANLASLGHMSAPPPISTAFSLAQPLVVASGSGIGSASSSGLVHSASAVSAPLAGTAAGGSHGTGTRVSATPSSLASHSQSVSPSTSPSLAEMQESALSAPGDAHTPSAVSRSNSDVMSLSTYLQVRQLHSFLAS